MVSVDALNSFFYNRSNSLINFNELYPKANIITRHQGVPKYAYSLSTNRYIPSAGALSLEDFKSVRCQTGSILSQCAATSQGVNFQCPNTVVSDNPAVTINRLVDKAQVLLNGRHIFDTSGFYERTYVGSYSYENRFKYTRINIIESDRVYFVYNKSDHNVLGSNDNVPISGTGIKDLSGIPNLAIVLIEDLNFNV